MSVNLMKAVVCIEPGKISIEQRPEPELVEGMVKVRIRRVGICGTDYHIYKGQHPFLEYPRVMGHELSGEVAQVHAHNTVKVGEKIIINPYIPCGDCVACRQQKHNCCVDISVLGVHADGGMCEYINVPEAQLYSAEGLSLDQAAMVEFLSIGAHGVRRGEIQKHHKVLVVGAGPIGLGAALFASIAGAKVAILDINEKRLSRAEELIPGLQGFSPCDELDAALSDFSQGDMFDVVMDATGNKMAMQNSLTYVAHGGSCVFVSVVKDDITFADPLFHSREMRIIGSRNATRQDFDHVIKCIRAGLVPTQAMNTHTASLEELPEKIPVWLDQQAVLIKAIARL